MPTPDPTTGCASDLQQCPPPNHLGQVDTDLGGLSVRELIAELANLLYPDACPSSTPSPGNAAAIELDARLAREHAIIAELRRRHAALRRWETLSR